MPQVFRSLFLGLIALLAPAIAGAPGRVLIADDAFDKVPFSDWVAAGARADIPCKMDVTQHGLTYFERILARSEVTVTGDNLIHHAADSGQLLFFVQFTDAGGNIYQSHNHIDLAEIRSADANATFTQNVLVIPGDYRLDFAVYDTQTKERSVAQRTLHIAALHSDPLPQIWDGAQSLEIVPDLGSPDKYFLPHATDPLHLPVDTHAPAEIQIIASGEWRTEIPAVKVLSDMRLAEGSANLAMLSYERRALFYQQDLSQGLDWAKLRPALVSVNPNVINADGLAGRAQNLEFFQDQLAQLACPAAASAPAASSGARILIIVSPALEFHDGEKMRALHLDDGCSPTVFYLRFQENPRAADLTTLDTDGATRFSMRDPSNPRLVPNTPKQGRVTDFLERTLGALHPKVLDVYSPEDFRKALATMLHDIPTVTKPTQATKGQE